MLNPSCVYTASDLIGLIKGACAQASYWFPDGSAPYDLFLFGVRDTANPDAWNDALGCVYRTTRGGELQLQLWPGTTDPGAPTLLQPQNPAGAAVIAPGQHRAVWKLGTHRGRPAFVQNRVIPVLRDADRDRVIDPSDRAVEGFYGINGHDAYRDGLPVVGEASAGCVVWHSQADHVSALQLAQQQERSIGVTTFSLTLFDIRTFRSLAPVLKAALTAVS